MTGQDEGSWAAETSWAVGKMERGRQGKRQREAGTGKEVSNKEGKEGGGLGVARVRQGQRGLAS